MKINSQKISAAEWEELAWTFSVRLNKWGLFTIYMRILGFIMLQMGIYCINDTINFNYYNIILISCYLYYYYIITPQDEKNWPDIFPARLCGGFFIV